MPSPYDEELTQEEQQALEAHAADNSLPPPDSEEGAPQDPPPADPEAKAPAADPAAEKPAGTDQQQDQQEQQQGGDDAAFKAFLEQHKDKTPEQLAELAFQQTRRANKAGFEARQSRESLNALNQRVKDAIARRDKLAAEGEQRKQGFREKLTNDPDAATAEIHDALVTRELQDAEAEVEQAAVAEAVGFARAHLHDFDGAWPEMKTLGLELGYTAEEISGIRDGRDLVTLGLARYAANAIKSGLMTPTGQITIPRPTPVADQVTDPRLTVPDPIPSIGNGAQRAGDTPPNAIQEMNRLLSMSDADFDKLSEEDLNRLMRQVA